MQTSPFNRTCNRNVKTKLFSLLLLPSLSISPPRCRIDVIEIVEYIDSTVNCVCVHEMGDRARIRALHSVHSICPLLWKPIEFQ